MRASLTVFFMLLFVAAAVRGQAPKGEALPRPAANTAEASYSIGFKLGSGFRRQGAPVDLQALIKGLQEGSAGKKSALTEEQMEAALEAFQNDVATRLPEKNKKEGEAFLAANAKQQGVKTTKSGLQYRVLKEGTGPSPKATDSVTTHYKGTLLDGTVFDSSYERNEPATFAVNGVITGWTEALQLMKVGSKWQLFVPSDLAYGPRGRPGIEPNATLVFEVELLAIEDGK